MLTAAEKQARPTALSPATGRRIDMEYYGSQCEGYLSRRVIFVCVESVGVKSGDSTNEGELI